MYGVCGVLVAPTIEDLLESDCRVEDRGDLCGAAKQDVAWRGCAGTIALSMLNTERTTRERRRGGLGLGQSSGVEGILLEPWLREGLSAMITLD